MHLDHERAVFVLANLADCGRRVGVKLFGILQPHLAMADLESYRLALRVFRIGKIDRADAMRYPLNDVSDVGKGNPRDLKQCAIGGKIKFFLAYGRKAGNLHLNFRIRQQPRCRRARALFTKSRPYGRLPAIEINQPFTGKSETLGRQCTLCLSCGL